MPMSHHRDIETGWVRIWISGSPSESELFKGAEELLSDPAFPRRARILSDHRGFEMVASVEFIHRIVGLLEIYFDVLRGSKIALVATEPVNFGMQRMLSMRADAISVHIMAFTEIEKARAWLELDD